MSLRIVAYRGLTPVEHVAVDEDGFPVDYEHYQRFINNLDFPGRFDGLQEEMVYAWAERYTFEAGAYSTYNDWRAQLAFIADYPCGTRPALDNPILRTEGYDIGAWQATEGPFWELITFSDYEGTLGPVVARKLVADFAYYAYKAVRQDAAFVRLYNSFFHAFRLAAQQGAVDFR